MAHHKYMISKFSWGICFASAGFKVEVWSYSSYIWFIFKKQGDQRVFGYIWLEMQSQKRKSLMKGNLTKWPGVGVGVGEPQKMPLDYFRDFFCKFGK